MVILIFTFLPKISDFFNVSIQTSCDGWLIISLAKALTADVFADSNQNYSFPNLGKANLFVSKKTLCRLETCKGSRDPKREHVCGRPLGLHFGKQGELYVADAYHGLLVVTAGDKFATPVVTETQGRSLRFTNSLDVDERTGVVYFTDSSKRFQRRYTTN